RGLPAPDPETIQFYDRPCRTVPGAMMADLLAGITDPDVAGLPPGTGTAEQWADAHTILSSPGRRAALRAAYREMADLRGLLAGQGDPVAVRVGDVGTAVAGEVALRLLQDRRPGAQRGDRGVGVVAMMLLAPCGVPCGGRRRRAARRPCRRGRGACARPPGRSARCAGGSGRRR
ncbi:MAG: hypothetical protein ACRDN0_39895, partial [Trebonia sp.]